MSVLAIVTSHRELVENLVLRDIKSRYKQSILGYAWAVFNPFVLALIYNFVGGFLFRQREANAFPFTIYSYFGILLWNLFSSGLLSATEGLVSHISLITKISFPREVFPVSAVMSKVVDFGFGLIGLLPLLLYYHTAPSIVGLLLLIPLLFLLLLFTTGLGLLTSCANLFYRDVRYLVQLLLGFWVYLVPNLYLLKLVEDHPQFLPFYLLNPIAVYIEIARRLVFPQTGPITPLLLTYLGIAAVVSVVLFALGFTVFKRYEPLFAESI